MTSTPERQTPEFKRGENDPKRPPVRKKLSPADWRKIKFARELVRRSVQSAATNPASAFGMIHRADEIVERVRRACAFARNAIGHDGYDSHMSTPTLQINMLSRGAKPKPDNLEAIRRNAQAVADTLGSLEFWGTKGHLTTQEVDLIAFFKERKVILERAFQVGQLDSQALTIQVPDQLIVRANPETLSTVITNMLRNAVKHGEATSAEIRAIANHVGQTVLEVLDNGKGMNDEVAEHVFELGFSGGKSSGIGLGDVDKRMKAMGGFAKCHPRGGLQHPDMVGQHGAKFELGVPLVLQVENEDSVPEIQMAG